MNPYGALREAVEAAKTRGTGVDPEAVLRLVDALERAEVELLPLRSIVSDLDLLMDTDLFTPEHSCLCQRRVAQWRREVWKDNFRERGGTSTRQTFGRGKGTAA